MCRRLRKVARDQFDRSILQHRQADAPARIANDERHARRLLVEACGQARQKHEGGIVRETEDELPCARGRVESTPATQYAFHLFEDRPHVRSDVLGQRSRHHATRRADEEWIAEQSTQPIERVADGRLGQPDPLGGARGMTFCNQGIEHHQQIQIDIGMMNCLHDGDTNNELDLSQLFSDESASSPHSKRREAGGCGHARTHRRYIPENCARHGRNRHCPHERRRRVCHRAVPSGV
jgi:hypothetical protein